MRTWTEYAKCALLPSLRPLRHPWAEVNCEIEVQRSRISGHPIQNLIIPQHFDSFVVRPSRRPIDGRGQKLDIELECPGRQINDSLRSSPKQGASQDRAACLQSIWTRLSPRGQNDLLYSSLTLYHTFTISGNVKKVHKYSTLGASLWLVNFTTRFSVKSCHYRKAAALH